MEEYKVKGSTIRTKFEWVETNYGEKDKTELEAEVARLVDTAPPYFDSSWYSFDIYVTVCEQIAKKYFNNNLSKLSALGEDSAKKALSTVYKSFTDRSFKLFMERIPRLHSLFYNQGHTEVEFDEKNKKCLIYHRNKDRYAEADLHIARGFYKRAAEIHQCDNVDCSFVIRDGHALYTLLWE